MKNHLKYQETGCSFCRPKMQNGKEFHSLNPEMVSTIALDQEHLSLSGMNSTWLWKAWASQAALVVKNLCASVGDTETRVHTLCWEDSLKEEMATPSSILAWKIPWTEEPGRLQSMESQRVRHDWGDLAHMEGLMHFQSKEEKPK